MIRLGYLWGLWHNVKGTEKQRGNSGARESIAASEDNAAKNISESRMHEENNNGRRQYG